MTAEGKRVSKWVRARRAVIISLVIFGFLLSLDMLKTAFSALGNDAVTQIIRATDNPFVGLFIGLLTTAIVQSSSTTTSIVVAMVAAQALSLHNAIPIVMGANVGTTVTCALVSLSHVAKKSEFRKALAAAVTHNLFNLFAVLVFFPLEMFTHILARTSSSLANWLYRMIGSRPTTAEVRDTSGLIPKMIVDGYSELFALGKPDLAPKYLLLALSLLGLLGSIRALVFLIKSIVIDHSKRSFETSFFGTQLKSLGWGFLFTALVQSSSVTTSLVIPLVGTGKISVRQAFPFVLGANVGTTITALIAALYKPEVALSIALVHFLFNTAAVLLFFPIPWVRNLPVVVAKNIGAITVRNRLYGFAYIMLVFFIIPFLLILASQH